MTTNKTVERTAIEGDVKDQPKTKRMRVKRAPTDRTPRLRESCDHCFVAKVKCSKGKPTCDRCLLGNHVCHYSPSTRSHRQKQPPPQAPYQARDAYLTVETRSMLQDLAHAQRIRNSLSGIYVAPQPHSQQPMQFLPQQNGATWYGNRPMNGSAASQSYHGPMSTYSAASLNIPAPAYPTTTIDDSTMALSAASPFDDTTSAFSAGHTYSFTTAHSAAITHPAMNGSVWRMSHPSFHAQSPLRVSYPTMNQDPTANRDVSISPHLSTSSNPAVNGHFSEADLQKPLQDQMLAMNQPWETMSTLPMDPGLSYLGRLPGSSRTLQKEMLSTEGLWNTTSSAGVPDSMLIRPAMTAHSSEENLKQYSSHYVFSEDEAWSRTPSLGFLDPTLAQSGVNGQADSSQSFQDEMLSMNGSWNTTPSTGHTSEENLQPFTQNLVKEEEFWDILPPGDGRSGEANLHLKQLDEALGIN